MTSLTKNASASPLGSALTKSLDLNSPGMNTYKKGGPPPCLLAPSYGILALRLCGGRENSDGTTKHCERNAVGADRGLFTGCARGFDGARLGHHGDRRQRKNCRRRRRLRADHPDAAQH